MGDYCAVDQYSLFSGKTPFDSVRFQTAPNHEQNGDAYILPPAQLPAHTCIQGFNTGRVLRNGQAFYAGLPFTRSVSHPVSYGFGKTSYNYPICNQKPISPPTGSKSLNSFTSLQASRERFSDSSDEDEVPAHPNKFPVAIEEHYRPECCYKRQPTRSGNFVKVVKNCGESYHVRQTAGEMEANEIVQNESDAPQLIRYYRKDLVRYCRCGKYTSKEPMLVNAGRDNDADGYEIHYSKKCKWKSYEDFKTKKKVLIRLCKCYKPVA